MATGSSIVVIKDKLKLRQFWLYPTSQKTLHNTCIEFNGSNSQLWIVASSIFDSTTCKENVDSWLLHYNLSDVDLTQLSETSLNALLNLFLFTNDIWETICCGSVIIELFFQIYRTESGIMIGLERLFNASLDIADTRAFQKDTRIPLLCELLYNITRRSAVMTGSILSSQLITLCLNVLQDEVARQRAPSLRSTLAVRTASLIVDAGGAEVADGFREDALLSLEQALEPAGTLTAALRGAPSAVRREILARLLSPVLQRHRAAGLASSRSVRLVEEIVALLRQTRAFDVENALLAVCLLLAAPGGDEIALLGVYCADRERALRLWVTVRAGLDAPDALPRRRGLHVTGLLCDLLAAAAPPPAAVALWRDLASVVAQAEGCNSVHLIEQVLPALDRVFGAAARRAAGFEEEKEEEAGGEDALPVFVEVHCAGGPGEWWAPRLSLAWAAAALHLLLRSANPGVRRVGLGRLLGGRLALRPGRATSTWLLRDVFASFADSVSVFSTLYADRT